MISDLRIPSLVAREPSFDLRPAPEAEPTDRMNGSRKGTGTATARDEQADALA